jgi:hypothetical protein
MTKDRRRLLPPSPTGAFTLLLQLVKVHQRVLADSASGTFADEEDGATPDYLGEPTTRTGRSRPRGYYLTDNFGSPTKW